jgi:hypothetical protein
MEIIREFFPNNMPTLIEGRVTRHGIVDPGSVKLYPIMGRRVFPAVPSLDAVATLVLAQRLTNILHRDAGGTGGPPPHPPLSPETRFLYDDGWRSVAESDEKEQ